MTPAEFRMLCCDACVVPVVLNGAGQPLDVGRGRRALGMPALAGALQLPHGLDDLHPAAGALPHRPRPGRIAEKPGNRLRLLWRAISWSVH